MPTVGSKGFPRAITGILSRRALAIGFLPWLAVASAAAAGDPCAAGNGPVFAVTNSGATDYVINGVNDPGLTLVRGCTYTFNINAAGHPFLIKSVQGSGVGNQYSVGVTNNGIQVGTLTWTVALDAPNALFYNCQFHAGMTGSITVITAASPDVVFLNGFD